MKYIAHRKLSIIALQAVTAKASPFSHGSELRRLWFRHRISEADYKKGQAEYQHELTAYEDQIAKYHGAMTGTETADE